MNFGYKSLIATVLVCAAWCKSKGNTVKDEVKAESNAVAKHDDDSVKNESVYVLKHSDARKPNDATDEDDRGVRPDNDENENELDSLNSNQSFNDSTALVNVCESIKDLEYDAVRLIALSENLEMNAYYDRAAGKWTIGFGNITHPDGSPVKRGDQIKDEAELMYYFRSFFSDRVAPNIVKYLPTWDKFSRNEKMALLDLFWNAGSGKLHTPSINKKTGKLQEVKPSELSNTLNAYVMNRTPENLKAVTDVMKSKKFISTKKKGIIPALQKRVAFRIMIFSGEISFGETGPNSIDLSKVPIGAHYGAFKPSDLYISYYSPEKIEIICDTMNNCPYGRNFADTLQYKLENQQRSLKAKQRLRRQPQRRKTPQRKEYGSR